MNFKTTLFLVSVFAAPQILPTEFPSLPTITLPPALTSILPVVTSSQPSITTVATTIDSASTITEIAVITKTLSSDGLYPTTTKKPSSIPTPNRDMGFSPSIGMSFLMIMMAF
ncbi:hypothetical protein BC833DRAFT_607047 [Globomyces pollinis-pini]|nr:hypothetical protein BC833DRAFT_607047 [Globomyces pollinis-pini]